MSKLENLVGQVFGKLTVVERDTRKTSRPYWLCKCSCGNPQLKSVRGSHLKAGNIQSCGCLASDDRVNDLTGKIFGRLTVLYDTKERYHTKSGSTVIWHCMCECGNECDVKSTNLISGNTQSCGCYKKERISETQTKDLIGKTFGRLTIEEKTNKKAKDGTIIWLCSCSCGTRNIEKSSHYFSQSTYPSCGCVWYEHNSYDLTNKIFGKLTPLYRNQGKGSWHCRCECGTECDIATKSLIKGNTQSCGCIKSIGENNIIKELQKNNIEYIKEKTFENLKNINTNCNYRYDFYLPEHNRLIEFDGEQHFFNKNHGWNNAEHFEKTQQSDKIKNEYALSHNIPLVRIPYWKRDNITLDILLEDKYLVTNAEENTEEKIIF